MFKSSNKIISAYGITILSTVVGTVCGLSMTILMAYPLSRRDLPGRNGLAFYVFFAVPMLLNNIMHLNTMLGINTQLTLTALQAGTICLALNCGAYMSEIIRAGIQSVDVGQMEAARSLGLPYWRAMHRVVMPQAIKTMIPSIINQFIITLKDTSILSIIGFPELINAAKNVNAVEGKVFEIWAIVGVMYLIVISILSIIAKRLERRLNAGRERG